MIRKKTLVLLLVLSSVGTNGTWFPEDHLLGGEPVGKLANYAVGRKWVDSTGKFTIEGKLKYADKDDVQILQENGKVVKIKLTGLSAKDQGFVQAFLEAEAKAGSDGSGDSPFKVVGDAPASSNMNSNNGSSQSTSQSKSSSQLVVPGESSDPGEPVKRVPVTKGAKLITAKMDKFFWAAKPALGFPEVKFNEVAVATEMKKPFFAGLRVMSAGKAGISVINACQQGRGEKDNYSRFAVVRASDGSVSDVLELKTPWKLMALSADGARVAAVRIEGWDKGNDVGIFKVTKNGLTPEFQFTAGGGAWDELHYVGFAAGNKLITISQKHTLLVWDIAAEKPKVIYQGNSGGALHAVLSPAGEMMALPAGNAIAVIDIAAAKVIGLISRENRATQLRSHPMEPSWPLMNHLGLRSMPWRMAKRSSELPSQSTMPVRS
ncbi:MAG: SHD1 domain-containing protein [Pirellulales bacterium]